MGKARERDEVRQKEQRLIDDHFAWGAAPHPAKKGLQTAKRRRDYVLAWLKEQTVQHEAWATALLARLRTVLDEFQGRLPRNEKHRFLFRFDASHLVKSPESILEKMARSWKDKAPSLGFRDLSDFKDLGRFRIVVNFLSDAERVAIHLAGLYRPRPGPKTNAEKELHSEFRLVGGRFENNVDLRPGERTKGERCFKACFRPEGHAHVSIEVQIATILQEAWDKKDHYLVYERRRVGKRVGEKHEIRMFSMSELLFIADDTFDRIKRDIDGDKEGGKR
jgi:ppGpp synthetase/RelA/SpoT-type nucleotidyltranferase